MSVVRVLNIVKALFIESRETVESRNKSRESMT